MSAIDLNSDLGESFGNYSFGDDAGVLASVSSANVACGFHAGDPQGIRATCRQALEQGVTIGAHPGYRDLAGFGRRFIDYDPAELTDEVIYQVGAVEALARSAGGEVRYVKPHGALYNAIAVHERQATAVVRALVELRSGLPLMVLPGSVVARVAREHGVATVVEAFADRAYLADGRLVPRSDPGAVHAPERAVAQAVRIATEGRITAIDGTELEIDAESICVHGDTPAAVRLAQRIRTALEADGVSIRSFA